MIPFIQSTKTATLGEVRVMLALGVQRLGRRRGLLWLVICYDWIPVLIKGALPWENTQGFQELDTSQSALCSCM